LSSGAAKNPAEWARRIADCMARGDCQGGIVFCQEPGLVCCVANKLAGLRATVLTTPSQACRIIVALGPNVVAIEATGRTFFELKQMLRAVGKSEPGKCPPHVSCVLAELDGHAHR